MSDTEQKETKKRPLNEEIEIDLAQVAPLSKKQKRLLRKGKLDLSKLEADQKVEAERLMKTPDNEEDKEKNDSDDEKLDKKPKETKPERFGVWIGNMSFDTLKEDLTRFIIGKTSEHDIYETGMSQDKPCQIKEDDILRINLPMQGASKKIKGFAYVDFATKSHQLAVIQLSESQLNGRKLLIKDSKSFEGRPTKEDVEMSKNPPSRILFVGNLSFDTTEDMLTQHFQHCGEIMKIRMATFQDSGKCKGFSFIDFKDEEGPTKALKDKSCKKLLNRPLRMEFGEDRSKRTPKHITKAREENESTESGHAAEDSYQEKPIRERSERPERPERSERPERTERTERERPEKKTFKKKDHNKKQPRVLSSIALASAQRGSAAIVKSSGKKTTF